MDLHQKQPTSLIYPHAGEHPVVLGPDLVDISVESGISQVATNIDKKEQQLQQDFIKQTVELQDFYEDDLSQFSSDDIKAAIASELRSLGKKNIYGELDIDSLTPESKTSNHQDSLGHWTSVLDHLLPLLMILILHLAA